ncbi:hypothetical protein ACFTRD_28940 [Paenibacillus sp. NPDC056933]
MNTPDLGGKSPEFGVFDLVYRLHRHVQERLSIILSAYNRA